MQNTISNLEKHGFEVIQVPNKTEALKIAKSFIKDGQKVGLGGSVSVSEIGLLDYILNHKNLNVSNQYEPGISMEENTKRRREGMMSDIFVSSSNAITKNGELVNADGSGNRVAAQIFGPKKVLLIVGINKIVDDVKAGFARITNIAAPKNIERINNTAIKYGKEPKHNMSNIGNKFAYIDADVPGRTTIILVNENLGY